MHVGYLNIVIIAAEGDRYHEFPNLFHSEYLFGILYLKTKCVQKYDFLPKTISLHVEK